MKGLTDTEIKKAKPADKATKLPDGRGLYLLITPKGRKLWRYRYWLDGKESTISFGHYPAISLKRAREKRDEAYRLIIEKKNPAVERRQARAARADTFRVVAEEWRNKQRHKAPETQRLMDWQLDIILPKLGDRPVSQITAHEVLALLQKLEERGKVVAPVVRQRIGQILRYAGATHRVQHDVTSLLRGALTVHRKAKHPGITSPATVGRLLRAIDTLKGEPATLAYMRILPHVFLRPAELRRARWDWIQGSQMHCPLEVMKLRRSHIVPLSPQVLALLDQMRPFSETWIFPGLQGADYLGHSVGNAALRRLKFTKEQHTCHGFRTTASTLLNSLGWNPDWIETQLAHHDGSVRGVYNEALWLPDRILMMRAWSDYLDALKGLTDDASVEDLERAALRGRPASHASISASNHPTLPPSNSTA